MYGLPYNMCEQLAVQHACVSIQGIMVLLMTHDVFQQWT